MHKTILAVSSVAILVAGCTTTTSPSTTSNSGTLELTELIVDRDLTAGVPYDIDLRYTGDASSVTDVCFLYSGDGPYCWTDFTVDGDAMLIDAEGYTGKPHTWELSGYVTYGDGKQSNHVSATIDVR